MKIFLKKGEEFEKLKVKKAAIFKQFVLFDLDGITDMDMALALKGSVVYADRADFKLSDGAYFIADIIGCALKTDHDSLVGEIIEVTSARTDIFTVKCTDGVIMRFPFLKDAIVSVDIENKLILVKAKRLSEIACYEN